MYKKFPDWLSIFSTFTLSRFENIPLFSAVSARCTFSKRCCRESLQKCAIGEHDFFFRAHRTNDLTRKLEKVGPFECDEHDYYKFSA